MTNPETLNALAEKIEAAEEGSRKLDAMIWYTVIEKPRPGDKIDKDMARNRWPHYTTSLDAAVAFCEAQTARLDGWTVGGGSKNTGSCATIFRSNIDEVIQVKASAPALALVAATLNALAAQEGG